MDPSPPGESLKLGYDLGVLSDLGCFGYFLFSA